MILYTETHTVSKPEKRPATPPSIPKKTEGRCCGHHPYSKTSFHSPKVEKLPHPTLIFTRWARPTLPKSLFAFPQQSQSAQAQNRQRRRFGDHLRLVSQNRNRRRL